MWKEPKNLNLDEILDPDRGVRLENGILYPVDGRSEADLRFVQEYRPIRQAEGRGSDDPEFYRRLPDGDFSGVREGEWRHRRRSLRWLMRRLGEEGPFRILDAGAGNCWLTHHLAARGDRVVALDVDDGEYDGLGAGGHYLRTGEVEFDRICSSFERIPLRTGALDLVIYNGALHYAENLFSVIAEGVRLLKPDGEIMILDSPLYSDPDSGERMVSERGGPDRARFLVRRELDRIAADLHLAVDYIPRSRSPLESLRRFVQRLRIGREPASMPWIVLRPSNRVGD